MTLPVSTRLQKIKGFLTIVGCEYRVSSASELLGEYNLIDMIVFYKKHAQAVRR